MGWRCLLLVPVPLRPEALVRVQPPLVRPASASFHWSLQASSWVQQPEEQEQEQARAKVSQAV